MDWLSFLWGFGICGFFAMWGASGMGDSSTIHNFKMQVFDLQQENSRLQEENGRLLSVVTNLAIKKMEGETDGK